jgi:hypothetical protein
MSCKNSSLIYKAAEDARAFVIIIDCLLFLCFIGYLYFRYISENLLILDILKFPISWQIVVWVVNALIAVFFILNLNKRILEAYTFEKEKKIFK